MASFSNAIEQPLNFIRSLLDESPDMLKNLDKVGEYVRTVIKDNAQQISCINENSLEHIPPNSMVRFRGMIQDMLDPEFYLGKYTAIRKTDNAKVQRYGCFTDTGSEQMAETIDFEAEGNVTLERQTYYCVPIPGESNWIKTLYGKPVEKTEYISTMRESKRKLEDDVEEEMETESKNMTMKNESPGNHEKKIKTSAETQKKETQSEEEKKPQAKIDYAKNFPLPEESGCPAFVKMYSSTNLKLNDTAEFYCIYSLDPHFASTGMTTDDMEQDNMVTWRDTNIEEDKAHCPPPSLVPRLHCVYFEKMKELNPHFRKKDVVFENVKKELSSVRSDLIQLLKQLLGGDALAAEYLLLHLISKVYGRVGAMCVGKMSLNLTRFQNSNLIQRLYKFLNMILEKSYYLPMTLDNLNNKRFVPFKDFEANRVASGFLQLSDDTNLILDETQMEPGKLNPDGLKNLTALGNVIQWQKLEYDFKFNQVGIETNINVLVLSEGKSLLKCDCILPVRFGDMDEQDNIDTLSPKLIEKFQLYLAIVRSINYELTEEVQKALEDDFVEMRKDDSKNMTADSFYLLLSTARYMALSHGQDTLSAALWTRVKELNSELRKRIGT